MFNFFLKRVKKNLIFGFSYKAGRNFLGRKTIFTQGGGLFSKFFSIDFKRNLPFKYMLLEVKKDINRTGLLGLICYTNGLFSYILLSDYNFEIGKLYDNFLVSLKYNNGNASFLRYINNGSFLHHLELKPKLGAKYIRSSGSKAFLLSKDKFYSYVKFPSGWLIKISNYSIGLIGKVYENIKIKKNIKAGDKRKLGFKPRVRGVAMNPCDHPHGGGEGKKSKPSIPKTPWGKWVKSPTKCTKLMYLKRKNWKKNG